MKLVLLLRNNKNYTVISVLPGNKEFVMNFEGAEKSVSGSILSGVDGADKVKCQVLHSLLELEIETLHCFFNRLNFLFLLHSCCVV